jgi:hypothetical protein
LQSLTTIPAGKIAVLFLDVTVGGVITVMGGDRSQTMEYIENVCMVDNIDPLAGILFRYAIMMLTQCHIAVTHYRII